MTTKITSGKYKVVSKIGKYHVIRKVPPKRYSSTKTYKRVVGRNRGDPFSYDGIETFAKQKPKTSYF